MTEQPGSIIQEISVVDCRKMSGKHWMSRMSGYASLHVQNDIYVDRVYSKVSIAQRVVRAAHLQWNDSSGLRPDTDMAMTA